MNTKALFKKINDDMTCVGVIGLCYVGLPLALAFSKKFHTIGFDVNEKCIEDTLKESDCSVFGAYHNLFKELDLRKCLTYEIAYYC